MADTMSAVVHHCRLTHHHPTRVCIGRLLARTPVGGPGCATIRSPRFLHLQLAAVHSPCSACTIGRRVDVRGAVPDYAPTRIKLILIAPRLWTSSNTIIHRAPLCVILAATLFTTPFATSPCVYIGDDLLPTLSLRFRTSSLCSRCTRCRSTSTPSAGMHPLTLTPMPCGVPEIHAARHLLPRAHPSNSSPSSCSHRRWSHCRQSTSSAIITRSLSPSTAVVLLKT